MDFIEDKLVSHQEILSDDCTLDSTEDIPVSLTAKRLYQGKWNTADELYHPKRCE